MIQETAVTCAHNMCTIYTLHFLEKVSSRARRTQTIHLRVYIRIHSTPTSVVDDPAVVQTIKTQKSIYYTYTHARAYISRFFDFSYNTVSRLHSNAFEFIHHAVRHLHAPIHGRFTKSQQSIHRAEWLLNILNTYPNAVRKRFILLSKLKRTWFSVINESANVLSVKTSIGFSTTKCFHYKIIITTII